MNRDGTPRLGFNLLELKRRADITLSGKSRSLGLDALEFAPIVLAYIELDRSYTVAIACLTEAEDRCERLAEENERLRSKYRSDNTSQKG